MTGPRPDAPARTFTAGQVLTLACSNAQAQQLFCSYGDLLEVLGYMLGDIPLAEEIPDAVERCRPAVLAEHPALANVGPPAVLAADTAVLTWLTHQETEHGTEFVLHPVGAEA
jgi:hypothetical protein